MQLAATPWRTACQALGTRQFIRCSTDLTPCSTNQEGSVTAPKSRCSIPRAANRMPQVQSYTNLECTANCP